MPFSEDKARDLGIKAFRAEKKPTKYPINEKHQAFLTVSYWVSCVFKDTGNPFVKKGSKMADEEEEEAMSHPELMALFRKELNKLMQDPLLADLPSEPTVEEVNAQLALEHGRAIVVNVRQMDEVGTILREFLRFIGPIYMIIDPSKNHDQGYCLRI